MLQSTLTRIVASSEGWICASCRHHQGTVTKRSLSSCRREAKRGKRHERIKIVPKAAKRCFTTATSLAEETQRRNDKLPDFPARTRFAPSPTGYMHIGGLRTALFSYLLAKRTNGQFILRIEDTDQKRFVPDAEKRLCEDLQWAGLDWDEGPIVGGPFGPYKQSERNHFYQEHAKQLLNCGSAYRCFCTPQTAALSGNTAQFVTSGCYQNCSSMNIDESRHKGESARERHAFTVRLKQTSDAHRRVYKDLVYGKIQRLKRAPGPSPTGENDDGAVAADTVLMKSDGIPTYHFANVVDDHLMQITHVIRGTEWMASTPLHYDLYAAFGWTPPQFAHVGLLVDQNKAKLSKRSDSGLVLDVRGMRDQEGVLPATLRNFLALLGWSNPRRHDVMDMDELIRNFDLKFTKGNTVVSNEKLWFLQKAHVAKLCSQAVTDVSLVPGYVERDLDVIVGSIHEHAARLRHNHKTLLPFNYVVPIDDGRLFAHCKEILLADSTAYQSPEHFVQRNSYYFTYDTAMIPEKPPGAAEVSIIQRRNLELLASDLLSHKSFQQAFEDSGRHSGDMKASSLHPRMEHTSHLIHESINSRIWAAITNDLLLQQSPNPALLNDATAYAAHIASLDPSTDAAGLLKKYKEWNKAFMRYLRGALSYGKPGPGIGHVMAILGQRECEQRIRLYVQS